MDSLTKAAAFVAMTLALPVSADFIQYNVTPHSSEIKFEKAVDLSAGTTQIHHFSLGREQAAVVKNLAVLADAGMSASLATVEQMQWSEQLPLVYAPKWQRDYGQYVLAIPELSRYPLAVNATLNRAVFNLANLVLTAPLNAELEKAYVLTTWWDSESELTDITLTFSRLELVENKIDYVLVPFCTTTVSAAKGLKILTAATQTQIKQMATQAHCNH